ncbi:MAG TPA: hypothetical protein VJL62_01230 [Thermodesulfobacteriota bacterium]|nr:hypothetical protein [Thermodesulfobacteriota bacterium]
MKIVSFLITFLFLATPAFPGWAPMGPYGGVITSVAVARDGVYIGTEGGGVFFSSDGGKKWEGRRKGLENIFVESLSVASDGSVYAGTRDGIFKSRDGKVWEPLPSIPKGSAVKNMTFDSDGNLYASLWGSGVFICKKDSECTNPTKELSSPFVNSILINEKGDVIAATEGGVFLKPKGNEKWRLGGLHDFMIVPTIAFDSRGILYAGTWASGIHYLGKDEWHFRNIGVASSMVATLARGSDGNLYAGTEGGASVLMQGAEKWSPFGLDDIFVKALGFGYNGEVYAGSYGRGFWVKEKGMEWEQRNKGICNSNILSVAVSDIGELFAGTKQGLHISLKGDNNWFEVSNLYGMKINSILIDGKRVYAGTSNGLFFGTPSEKVWKRVEGEIGYMPVTSLAKADQFIYAGTDSDGIFRGEAGKGEFNALNDGLENFRIRGLVTVNNSNIYAGTYGGIYAIQKGMSKWSKAGLQESVIVSIAANSGSIFAAAENKGVFALTDGKLASVEGALPNKRILSLFHTGKGLYAGGYGWLVYREGDGHWKDVTGELSNTVIQTITADKSGKVYAGTWGSGIWGME